MGAMVKPATEIRAEAPAKRISTRARARAVARTLAAVAREAETGHLSAEVVAMYRALHPDGDS